VPYVHLLPEYRAQLDVSLLTDGDPNILECFIMSKKMTKFDFGEFPYHPLEINALAILNYPHKQKFIGFELGELGGQAITSPVPVHRPGGFPFRYLGIT
jgi:hypothetical protein